jgi:hypothetical protein
MSNQKLPFFLLLCRSLLLPLVCTKRAARAADRRPTSADLIAAARPDIANSSLVVPPGGFGAESSVDWTVSPGRSALGATNTRLRLGLTQCAEFRIDAATCFGPLNRMSPAGFSDVSALDIRSALTGYSEV